jgi:thiol-disulfide isomerase/thioredoxin
MVFLSLCIQSQTVVIRGTAPGAEGKRIQVITYSDLLTGLEKTIAQATIDSTASFSLSLNVEKTISAYLNIDFHRGELFIEPGKSYSVSIGPMTYNDQQEVNPFVESQSLDLTFRDEKSDDLNALIQSFNKDYNAFVLENFNYLYRDKDRAKLDTFRVKVTRKFPLVKNAYFNDYVKYKLASLEQVANVMGKTPMIKKYFSDPPVLYDNVEYMDFFKEFFSKYITTTSRFLKFQNYKTMLEGPNSYATLMKALSADTLLRKPQLRELVLLRSLMEMYEDPLYTQERVETAIRATAKETRFEGNKLIAENIITYLNRLKPGSPAPEFTLEDRNHKKVSLADLKGKPVLLGFWTTYCQSCLSEMEALKPIYDKYHDKMTFVSISGDKEFIKMNYFLKLKKDFVWTFLHLGDEYRLLLDYDVRSFPLFVLIDSQGKILKYPAELPSAGLDQSIERILNP